MTHFPAFLDLRGRPALVVGTGEVAERKSDALRRAGAVVAVVPTFDPAHLQGCAVAVGADAPDSELLALSQAAQAAGIPVNVVDRPELCSFITPAVVDRAPVIIAVSSGGAAPVLARLVRARIEAMLPPALGRLADLLESAKTELRRMLPNPQHRRRVIERALSGLPADRLGAGDEAGARAALLADAADAAGSRPQGTVYLVGAGPGAADLLTLRAHRIMGEADVIVHDRLVTPEVLDMARRDAERIYVGKQRANHCMAQDDINALLVRLAQEGKRVVRLKGGDPFVFGRGGEEMQACREAGVPCEVVPGVTAALACAAQAGIPLTHRAVARTLTLATGHTKDGRLELDFAQLARGGTVAVYMGLSTLPQLRDGLLQAGLRAGTPAALIERGGTDRQRTLTGTLNSLAEQAPGWTTGGPVLAVIGEAVALAPGEAKAGRAVEHAA